MRISHHVLNMEETVPFSLSQNGEYALYSSPDGVLKLWETETNVLKQQYTPSAHLSATCTCLSWSPMGHTVDTPRKKKRRESKITNSPDIVAIGTTAGNILLYSVKIGDLQSSLDGEHSDRVNGLCWRESDLSLFSCSNDSNIVHWEISSNKRKHKWKGDKGSIHSVCLCSENHLLSAGRSIKLWNTETYQVLKKFTGHATEVFRLLPVPFTMNSTPDSIDHVYFLSAAINDRIINAWHVNTKSSDKTAVASFSLPDEPIMLDVSKTPTQDQNVLLSVVTKSGQVLIFEHMLNGKLKRPVKPKVTIQIATTGSRDDIPRPVPILAVYICNYKESSVLIAYGNFLKPVFEKVSYNSDEPDVCLIRDDPNSTSLKTDTSSISKVKTPKVSKDLTVLVPETMAPSAPSQDSTRRKRRKSSVTEMSMEDRLNAISMDSQSEKPLKVPQADNLARLLTQGLQSHDRKIIIKVLSQRKDDVIKKTVKKLPVQAIIPLTQELTRSMQWRAASCQTSVKWIKTLLTVHSSYLMTYPEIVEKLSSLYQMMDSRTAMFSRLSRLQGKLDLILSQISSQEHQEEEQATEEQPLLMYQEESSDEDGLEDFGNSQSDTSFDDMDLFESDTEAAAENGDEEMVSD